MRDFLHFFFYPHFELKINRDLSLLILFTAVILLGASCAPMQLSQQASIHSGDLTGLSVVEELEIEEELAPQEKSVYYKVFPSENNPHVEKWLRYFSTGNGRDDMKRYLQRSQRYILLMQSIFREKNLPEDLVYISMAESGFNAYARSSADAVGYWQFIYSTGDHYGLIMNNYVDERHDFVLSTQAAANYLKDLYNVFEDWRLSMAAYNCGERCVNRAIRSNNNSRNFWHLVENKSLPSETRNYVPKIIAMRKIALKPRAYGFDNLEYQEPLDYSLISINGTFTLSSIARTLKVPHQELKGLNSKFKTDRIVLKDSDNYIRVPASVSL